MYYTKLDKSIVYSSIWQEPLHIKVLWITLLAICDKYGLVSAAVPGLASVAGITLKQTEQALEVLMAPDPHDKSGVNEGRRLVKIEGGYEIVNYQDYFNKHSDEVVKEKARLRVKRHRERKAGKKPNKKPSVTLGNACNADVTLGNGDVTLGNAPLRSVTSGNARLRHNKDKDKDIRSTLSKERESNGSAVRPLPEEALRWNVMAEERNKIPKVVSMSPLRRKKLLLRRKSPDWDDRIGEVLEKINKSNFCNGENDRGWVATFDWLLANDDNLLKVLEGKYDNRIGRNNNAAGKNQPSRFSTKLTGADAPESDYSQLGRNKQVPGGSPKTDK